ncbi:MAG: isoaspartyl peptidase/L-asparaginase [Sphingomonadales bacterium]|nr:isoaspartyl peptidase/L-asparaginase [Sphingomonadales bacterium]
MPIIVRPLFAALLFALSGQVHAHPGVHQSDQDAAKPSKWSIVIHGGAGVIERGQLTPEKEAEIRAALELALNQGAQILAQGGSAMDAVTATITTLENDPNFNAGYGAVLDWDGRHQLDASIMDGRDRSAGAVAGVHYTKNPILLARAVKDKSDHVMLSGEGADQFSREQGLEQVEQSYFTTSYRLDQLKRMKEKALSAQQVEYKYGTVGAAAMDSDGNLAAGTSTGGMTGKRWGRIGDSPVIGAGTYADNRACAVSATGWGEYFIRIGVAHEICARMRLTGESPQTAADHVMKEVALTGGDGGVVVMGKDGTAAYSFNSKGMYRGHVSSKSSAVDVAIYGDEE